MLVSDTGGRYASNLEVVRRNACQTIRIGNISHVLIIENEDEAPRRNVVVAEDHLVLDRSVEGAHFLTAVGSTLGSPES